MRTNLKSALPMLLAQALAHGGHIRFRSRKGPRAYDQPSFLSLMCVATDKDQMNDILMTARASKASPGTIRKLERAYDQRGKELAV